MIAAIAQGHSNNNHRRRNAFSIKQSTYSVKNQLKDIQMPKTGLEDGRATRVTHRKISLIELSILLCNFSLIYINVIYVSSGKLIRSTTVSSIPTTAMRCGSVFCT